MRYQVKFVNGFWVSFDTVNYENTNVFYLQKDAVEKVAMFNQREVK